MTNPSLLSAGENVGQTAKGSTNGNQQCASTPIEYSTSLTGQPEPWKYEVFPTEPLHDLKGHIHLIEEVIKKACGETLQILKQVQDAVLSKCTLRCSDYRKAVILIYKSLQQSTNPDAQIMELFRTVVEITEIMYAPDSNQEPS